MSEVRRYKSADYLPGMWPDKNGGYVEFKDYDSAKSELTALHRLCDDRFNELAALREELEAESKGADKVAEDLLRLNRLLTAAEQRNADVEKRAADLIECLWGIELPGAGNPRLRKLRRALEALKPTESGASDFRCVFDGGQCSLGGQCKVCPHRESGASE